MAQGVADKKRRFDLFSSDIRFAKQPSLMDMRQLAISEPDAFLPKMAEAIEAGDLRLDRISSMTALFDAFWDVEIRTRADAGRMRDMAVTTSAFPILTGMLVQAQLMEAYRGVPTIGQDLVKDLEVPQKVVRLVKIAPLDNQITSVEQGDSFPEVKATEKSSEVRSLRNGRSLKITAETIEQNQIGEFVGMVNGLGELAGKMIEKQTLDRVCDVDGSATSPAEPYVYRPRGVGTSLYQTDNTTLTQLPALGNRIVSNSLVDATDLDTARQRLAAMKDESGDHIYVPISECTLLVPDSLAMTAVTLLNSAFTPGMENEINPFGPQGQFRVGRFVTTPLLGRYDVAAWYLGNFQAQFVRKWALKFEYAELGQTTQAWLDRRIAAQFRIAWDVEIGASDYVYVVQNLPGSTAPARS